MWPKAEHDVLVRVAEQAGCQLAEAAACVLALDNPAALVAKTMRITESKAQGIFAVLKKMDAAHKAAKPQAKAPLPAHRVAHDSCPSCGRLWAGKGAGAKICPICTSDPKATVAAAEARHKKRMTDIARAR